MNTSLNDLRDKINQIDSALLRLLSLRFALCKEIKEIKNLNNIPITQTTREEDILNALLHQATQNSPTLCPDHIKEIWLLFFKISKEIQNQHEKI